MISPRRSLSVVVAVVLFAISSPTPRAAAGSAGCGRGTIRSVAFPPMGPIAVAGRIYLPPGYASSGNRRYPLLILLHGAAATDEQWADLGIAPAADTLICAHRISPLLIALPDGGKDVPPEIDHYVVATLMAWLDASYRVRPDGTHRSIGGISRGGGAALRIGAAHPEVFASVGAHSPAATRSVAELSGGLAAMRGGVFIDVGKSDALAPTVVAFSHALAKASVRNELHVWAGRHDRPYWRAHVDAYLRFYSDSWAQAQRTQS